ncbi:conserved exported hypothetical protein [Candidatus Zixiibacteriota bacterium]|nr:conserved exported hypothetical protein [candidate division Zixibacteria bacterium]
MRVRATIGISFCLIVLLSVVKSFSADGKILVPREMDRIRADSLQGKVVERGFHSAVSKRNILKLSREEPWMLPKAGLKPGVKDTIRILAMRFDFQYESPDDPNTTGRGHFDMRDTTTFKNEEGHMIDPSPHIKRYFEKHLEALALYYHFVSEGKVALIYDVYPSQSDSVYHLPHSMGYYGAQRPDSGLSEYVTDAIKLADTSEPAINFADYDSYILFHAGSDRQNDIGFPPTTSDLYTGNVFLGDPVYVDKTGTDSTIITDAVVMPETACQDNRATALNAVMVHEFGHQLGAVDLYNTQTFLTQVGDFSTWDNNGFGTGIDFGFVVGRVFGTMAVYPDAWHRAFFGFVEPVVFRSGTDIPLVADEMIKDGIKIAKIPISEYEYYLLENRREDIDGKPTALLADSVTSVILGPIDLNRNYTHEYDFLLPGSGILIWHVDERVALMDYDGDGINNFNENQLQLDPSHRFVELMEADGLINFGGYYYAGFGSQEDMYYAGNNSSFTPNTNPPSIGYYGINSHIRITGISPQDTTMSFSVEYDNVSDGFPRRAGYPAYSLNSIAADLDNDGNDEIIDGSNQNLVVMKQDGSDFLPEGVVQYDSSYSLTGKGYYPVPLFAKVPFTITAGPVVGYMGTNNDTTFVAVGASSNVYVYSAQDNNHDGLADPLFTSSIQPTMAMAITSGKKLIVAGMKDTSYIQLFELENGIALPFGGRIVHVPQPALYGINQIGNSVAMIAGEPDNIRLYYFKSDGDTLSFDLEGNYTLGPVCTDLDRNGLPEEIVASPTGRIKAVTIDTATGSFANYGQIDLRTALTANPVAADFDNDGFADIIVGGKEKIYGLDRNFISLTDFPIMIDRKYPNDDVLSAPIVADIDGDRQQDIIVGMSSGNCYAFGPDLKYGFPVASGGVGIGSPVVYKKANGGGLGFLGVDGWFYSYDISYDSTRANWRMGGADAQGSFNLPLSKFSPPANVADILPREKFFCYPNPAIDGRTTIRYFLGRDAEVTLTMYDLSGKQVDQVKAHSSEGTTERTWSGAALPTGVYRCVLKADFGGDTRTAFTDIAVIK